MSSFERRLGAWLSIGLAGAFGAASCGDGGSGGGSDQGTAVGAGGATPGGLDCRGFEGDLPDLKLTKVIGDLVRPVFMTAAPGDPDRLYVMLLDGKILVVEDGKVISTFLDIDADVRSNGYQGDERGLLGLAFHPGFASNGRFFVFHTKGDSNDNVVEEYVRSADPLVATPTPVKELVRTTMNAGNHNGGCLGFGGDGKLYVAVGDGGTQGDPEGDAQNLMELHGKILRLDVDTYPTPPAGNYPGANPHVWDIGFRNPWRFSFDACTQDLYIGDVGQDEFEEISVEPAGQGNKNYGWNEVEGEECFMSGCDMSGTVLPVAVYDHNRGASVTGGYVYRSGKIPGLRGMYLYGDFGSNRVWGFRYQGGAAVDQIELSGDLESEKLAGIASFGQDGEGNVYVVEIGSVDPADDAPGAIYRIDAE